MNANVFSVSGFIITCLPEPDAIAKALKSPSPWQSKQTTLFVVAFDSEGNKRATKEIRVITIRFFILISLLIYLNLSKKITKKKQTLLTMQ
jgi:hypothetical protein